MMSAQCEQLSRELREKRDINPTSLAETRANFELHGKRFPLDADIRSKMTRTGDLDVLRLYPPGANEARCLLYFHGGGYIIGSPATHASLVGRLARAASMTAVIPNYRKAPEHPHPAPLEDAIQTYQMILAEGFRPENIVIAGDSAGGGLTLATLLQARNLELPLPAAAVCMSPWVDMESKGDSVRSKADVDPVVAPQHIQSFARMFVGAGDPKDPLASPLHADLTGLPPLLIQVGENETLLDDSLRIAARAAHAGVDTTLRVWPHMFHVWQLFAPELDEGLRAILEAAEFMVRHLEPADS